VREYVATLIRGKQLIGYHLPQKMADFGLLNSVAGGSMLDGRAHIWEKAFDIAKIFNATDSSQQQPMSTLCEKYLNLNYKKRPSPFFAFTEAKISMALYKQWLKLTKQAAPVPAPMSFS